VLSVVESLKALTTEATEVHREPNTQEKPDLTAPTDHYLSITFGTLKNVPPDSGAFASATSVENDLRKPS
jgi:hypothetical protein